MLCHRNYGILETPSTELLETVEEKYLHGGVIYKNGLTKRQKKKKGCQTVSEPSLTKGGVKIILAASQLYLKRPYRRLLDR